MYSLVTVSLLYAYPGSIHIISVILLCFCDFSLHFCVGWNTKVYHSLLKVMDDSEFSSIQLCAFRNSHNGTSRKASGV
jgi:hypothetical protein